MKTEAEVGGAQSARSRRGGRSLPCSAPKEGHPANIPCAGLCDRENAGVCCQLPTVAICYGIQDPQALSQRGWQGSPPYFSQQPTQRKTCRGGRRPIPAPAGACKLTAGQSLSQQPWGRRGQEALGPHLSLRLSEARGPPSGTAELASHNWRRSVRCKHLSHTSQLHRDPAGSIVMAPLQSSPVRPGERLLW